MRITGIHGEFVMGRKDTQGEVQIQATFIQTNQMITGEDVRYLYVKISDGEVELPPEVE